MLTYARLFRKRNFAFITLADAVSVLGDQIGWVALLWFAMVTTGHSRYMGLVALAFGLPGVFLGAVVGTILDRTAHKKVLFIANVLLGVVFMAIPLLYRAHALPMSALFSFVLLAGCLTPFTNVGWMVIVPTLVSDDELGMANSVVETIWNAASLVGPLIAGLMIAHFGATSAVFADGVSFWIAAICVVLMKESQPYASTRKKQDVRPHRPFFQDTWHGIKTLYGLKIVWWITLGAVCINLVFGQLEVSLPLYTHKELAESVAILGSFWATYFVSSLIGSALIGFIPTNNRSGLAMALMVTGWGICFLPLIWLHSLWITYVALACSGLLFGGYPPIARTTVQKLVPMDVQGRIFGIRGSIIAIGVPVGSFASGTLGQWLSASSVIGISGFIVVMLGLLMLTSRVFRTA